MRKKVSGFRCQGLGIIFTSLCLCGQMLGQEVKPVTLTELERTKIELVRAKQANLQLQYNALLAQIEEIKQAHPKLVAEERALVAEAAKEHGVDLKTHRLKADGTGFEPVPAEKAAKQ